MNAIKPVVQPAMQTEPKPIGHENPKLWELSKDFEALLNNQMIGAMRKTVKHSGIVPQSHAEKIYQSMLDTKHAQHIAETGQIGLAQVLYRQLLQQFPGR